MTEREKNALEELGQRRLPAWEELPDLALYMDQVLSLTARYLPGGADKALTAAMVNNYTKNGLLPRAVGKKYNREHLAYLTAICVLKRVMSARDIDLLFQEELGSRRLIPEGYEAFRESLDSALAMTADEMAGYADGTDLADAAIHFALMSYAAGVASSRYVALLRQQREAAGEAQHSHGKDKSKKELK